jgi:hypothetical protein
VDQKGQDDEAGQQRRQMLLAVAVVVLEVVTLGFQGVVVFIFDLPAATPGLDDLRQILVIECQGSRKGVLIQYITVLIGGCERAPVNSLSRNTSQVVD